MLRKNKTIKRKVFLFFFHSQCILDAQYNEVVFDDGNVCHTTLFFKYFFIVFSEYTSINNDQRGLE